ncbi:MAG: hypothetical protein LH702_29980 [Phormidesmis sp. CAN_BIN44]|jgi:hypothetical protein|nr:hypothetical protein [Phormidesmis sp. CAN_BIN44]
MMNFSEVLKKLTVRMGDDVKAALEKYADNSGLSEAAAAERFIALGLYNNGLLEQVPPVERRRGGRREGSGRKPKQASDE